MLIIGLSSVILCVKNLQKSYKSTNVWTLPILTAIVHFLRKRGFAGGEGRYG